MQTLLSLSFNPTNMESSLIEASFCLRVNHQISTINPLFSLATTVRSSPEAFFCAFNKDDVAFSMMSINSLLYPNHLELPATVTLTTEQQTDTVTPVQPAASTAASGSPAFHTMEPALETLEPVFETLQPALDLRPVRQENLGILPCTVCLILMSAGRVQLSIPKKEFKIFIVGTFCLYKNYKNTQFFKTDFKCFVPN